MNLNEKQQLAYDLIKQRQNVFLSGPGGVGKSTVVNKLRGEYSEDTVFLAPTGIAALNINGATIHSSFGFPVGFMDENRRGRVSKKAEQLFGNDTVKRIVLDEISMVRGDLFSAIDKNLRVIKGNKKPFGGLQLVGVGDFYQLSPVLNLKTTEGQIYSQEFRSPYCFDAPVWEKAGLMTVELDQIMRQNDPTFIFALNSIRRLDSNAYKSLRFINTVGRKNADKQADSDMLMLCATNADADAVNRIKYDELEGQEFEFYSETKGDFKDEPAPRVLRLKKGCKVLICANNAEEGYYNGDRGVVTEITNSSIRVETETGRTFKLERNEWKAIEYEVKDGMLLPKEVGSYIQFPVKLGYAITIHKSQGMTLEKAAIFTGRGCFATGQAYVALSRIRSLEGLAILQDLLPSELKVDPLVKQFYETNSMSNLFGAMS